MELDIESQTSSYSSASIPIESSEESDMDLRALDIDIIGNDHIMEVNVDNIGQMKRCFNRQKEQFLSML